MPHIDHRRRCRLVRRATSSEIESERAQRDGMNESDRRHTLFDETQNKNNNEHKTISGFVRIRTERDVDSSYANRSSFRWNAEIHFDF